MKYVVNNKQVPHLWANQFQERAQGNGSISFTGTVLYSYAAAIGNLVTAPNGERVALLISRTWSVTTSSHQSAARSAVSHLTNFTVPNIGAYHANVDHGANLEYLTKNFQENVRASYRKRTFTEWAHSSLVEQANNITAYARVFTLDGAPSAQDMTDQLNALAAFHDTPDKRAKRALRQANTEAEKAAQKLAVDAARAAAQIKITEWRAGLRNDIPGAYRTDDNGGALIRIRGDVLETSRGAEVPLEHAKRLFKRLIACREAGQEWHRNGATIHVGHFQVDHINADGSFVAGCHRFSWPEIERAAITAGVLEETA